MRSNAGLRALSSPHVDCFGSCPVPGSAKNQKLALHHQLGESQDVGDADLRIDFELGTERLRNRLQGARSIGQLDDPFADQRWFASFIREAMHKIPMPNR